MTQATLFDHIHETAFEAYHRDNPAVYEAFVRFTLQAIGAGRKHIGAKMIAERLRFESMVAGNDGFKINNSHISYYARMFERDYPGYHGVFEFRKSKADAVIGV